jgi:hypothetical protein
MIEIKMASERLPLSIERQARVIIQTWQESRSLYDDPDVRVVAHIGGIVVVYDGTTDLTSLVQDMERQAEGLHTVEAAVGYTKILHLIKEAHVLAQTFECALTFEWAGHPIKVCPEDDPLTLCQEYLSQWEG